jgi:hypothetical protein
MFAVNEKCYLDENIHFDVCIGFSPCGVGFNASTVALQAVEGDDK